MFSLRQFSARTMAAAILLWSSAGAAQEVIEENVVEESPPTEAIGNYYRHARTLTEPIDACAPAPADNPSSSMPIPPSWTETFFDPQPRISLRAEAVWFQPNFENSLPLAQQVQSNGAGFEIVPVGVRGNTEYNVAPQTFLQYHWNEQGSLEFGGFWMEGPDQSNYSLSDDDQTYFFDANAALPNERGFVTNAPPGFPLVSTLATLDWRFQTYSTELNLWHHFICMKGRISDLAVGIGGRYLSVNETVSLNLANELDLTTANLRSEVTNDIAGPQFVFRGQVNGPGQRARFLAIGKIGLMANGGGFTNELSTGASPTVGASDFETIFSPLFEGLFSYEFYICRNISIYGGYQLLFVDRVQRSGGHFFPDMNQFISDDESLGDLFLHGPRLGLLATF